MDKRIVYIAYPCFVLSGAAVNILLKSQGLKSSLLGWAQVVYAVELNGIRLVVAGLVLVAVALLWRVDLSARGVWRCGAVGLLMMAVPQGLLFYALSRTATANTAAFAEATIPGIVLIYLLAGGWQLERAPALCVTGALAGLLVFLYNEPSWRAGGAGDILIVLASSAVTAFGFVLSGILPKPSAPGLGNKLRNSLRNNIYMTCTSGGATLGLVAALSVRPVPLTAWEPLMELALVGTCLGWISFFLLLAEDVVLASSAIIAIPIVNALASAAGVAGGRRLTALQWPSAIVALVALAILMRCKLSKTSTARAAGASSE
jgi:hypothetical protein